MVDFYLGSDDSTELNAHPRACTVVGEIATPRGDIGLSVCVDPPLAIPRGEYELSDVWVLPARHAGVTLRPMSEPTPSVYVVHLPSRGMDEFASLARTEYDVSYWGVIYRSLEDALRARFDATS